jgi:integrase
MPYRPKGSRFWHYDFQIKGRRFCGSCGTENYEQAKAVEAQARVQARATPDRRGSFTLSEALGTYWADIAQHQTSSGTTLSQGKGLLTALDGAVALDRVTMADVMGYVSRRRAHVSNATVNRELQLLGRALRHMAAIHAAQIAELNLPRLYLREPRERIRELSPEEQARLFAKLRPDLHALVQFALMTGAREATICGLQWSQVDLANSRIRFDMKGDEVMFFPINGELRAFLSTLPRSDLPAHRAYVITYVDRQTNQRKRITAGGGGLKAQFIAACVAAEVANFRFHDLRHTFGTRMLRKTQNLKLVQRLMGHQNIETTERYAHVIEDDLHRGVDGYTALSTTVSRRKSRSAS